MKSFFALIVEAVASLVLRRLQQPLTIIATADEETSMCGARALQHVNRHLGRHVVIGEPTSLKPVRMHKGMAT
jgi:acetylornithine deacetylase